MKIPKITVLAFCLSSACATICSGPDASPNWYGSYGYPPWFTRYDDENCPQKYSMSKCEQSAVMMDGSTTFATNDLDEEVCTVNGDCFTTKQNCNDNMVCADLLSLKAELKEGGHNIVCRHEKTYWQQYMGEVLYCHAQANCITDPMVEPSQRQMQPFGYQNAQAFTEAFSDMGIPIDSVYSSPFTRCSDHADLFTSEVPNEPVWELMYMGGAAEVANYYNITPGIKPNALKWQAFNIRNFAGKKPKDGFNNVMVTHGFNIKLGFGLPLDEGYCIVLKPEDSLPSLAESIGEIAVGDQVFTFDEDAYPVDAIARMSAESANLMQMCSDIQANSVDSITTLMNYDADGDMKVSKEEFVSSRDGLSNAVESFEFIKLLQPTGLLFSPDTLSSSTIDLGQFVHMNWGWRNRRTISYPWRTILENTMGSGGSTTLERLESFDQANYVLTALLNTLENDDKYPTLAEMERILIECDTSELSTEESESLNECSMKTNLGGSGGDWYYPLGPGDGGAASTQNETSYGSKLTYPSIYEPDFYESKYTKVAKCLVIGGEVEIGELITNMGCTMEIKPECEEKKETEEVGKSKKSKESKKPKTSKRV
mmetsp:Transcript_28862/g.31898  ORF Transcript_28862/g.31898 Transcript_28862/m.31898 type:complete len:597 (+) Transcript_28862:108-1898(+)